MRCVLICCYVAPQVGTDRKTIRKSPELVALHEWLKVHTNNGNITRQEAVSMVPPLALDVQPWHKVLGAFVDFVLIATVSFLLTA